MYTLAVQKRVAVNAINLFLSGTPPNWPYLMRKCYYIFYETKERALIIF